ncbi:MAG: nitroreductase family protein [Bacillota bacterium]|nr:nitroreductase family protein [Bacillota bacterium]
MEFKDVVRGRRSVRKYLAKKIDRSVLNEVLEDAMWAPSGVNIQPWHFVVAESDEAMAKVLELMRKAAVIDAPHLHERFQKNPEVAKNSLGFIADLGGAPTAIMAFQGKDEYPLMEDGVIESVSAAIENLVLSAYDHGLSTCWLTAPMQADMDYEFRDAFAPGKGRMLAIICIGYAEESKIPKAPARKDGRVEFI